MSTNNQLRGAFDKSDAETGDKKVEKRSKKSLKDKDMMAKYSKNELMKKSGKKGSKSKGIKMSDEEADQKGDSNKKNHKKN